jgi:Kelch motif
MSARGAWLSRTSLTAVLAAALAVVGTGLPAAQAAAGRPQVLAGGPVGRQWPSFAYDPALSEFVMFGGNQRGVYGETWIYQGGAWTEEHPAQSPAPRTGAAMVYDTASGQLLLFGGSRTARDTGFFADTWVWTGTTWQQLHPATSPPARHNADMIYDAADQDVVLFGGFGGRYLGDTWTWNGSTWTQQDTGTAPEPRDTGSFAYDAATGTGILYGGYDGNIPAFTDTWSWNGSTWHRLHPTAKPGRVSAAWQMTGDPATGQVMLFGGQRANHTNADATWAWNGTTWTQLNPASAPRGRGLGAMSYDSATQQIVIFGGQDADQDGYPATSWAWNGTTWHKLT